MYSCDIFADVDFGHGLVEIRCTETGEHTQHKCEVMILPQRSPQQQNIFEGSHNEQGA